MDMKHLLSVIDNIEEPNVPPAKPVLTENKLAEKMRLLSEGNDIETLPAVSIEKNPVDTVTIDIPLLIRLFEYSREDANTDMDLHQVAEKMVELSKEGKTLSMDDYDAICGNEIDEDGEHHIRMFKDPKAEHDYLMGKLTNIGKSFSRISDKNEKFLEPHRQQSKADLIAKWSDQDERAERFRQELKNRKS